LAAEVGGEAVKETMEAADVAREGLQLVAGGEQLVQAAVGLSVVNGILKPES
jgi:hypothetical protein